MYQRRTLRLVFGALDVEIGGRGRRDEDKNRRKLDEVFRRVSGDRSSCQDEALNQHVHSRFVATRIHQLLTISTL